MKTTISGNTNLLSAVIELANYQTTTAGRKVLKAGRVKVNGKVEQIGSKELKEGDSLEITGKSQLQEQKRVEKILDFPFPILFEDDEILVIEKPYGILSTPLDKKKMKNVLDIADRYIRTSSGQAKRAFPVQSLEKSVSGVMLLTKTHNSQKILLQNWKNFTKRYYALCEGEFEKEKGEFTDKLKENRIGLVYADNRSQHSKAASTDYRVINRNNQYSLLKLTVHQEIKNQIRAHLAANSTPIAGDKRYEAVTDPIKRICLHMFSLIIVHPVTEEELEFKTAVPYNFNAIIKGRKLKMPKV